MSPEDKSDPRHWMNRAWTLQETQEAIIIAGRSPSSPPIPYITHLGEVKDQMYWRQCMDDNDDATKKTLIAPFFNLEFPRRVRKAGVFEALDLMRHRSATSELDKIAGLIFRLNRFNPPLPAYVVGEDPEGAWSRLIEATREDHRAHLFFLYPEPGNGKYVWYPSWQQIKDIDALPIPKKQLRSAINVDGDKYSVCCHCLEHCFVKGLSKVRIDSGASVRKGIAIVDGHTLKIEANHNNPIPDGVYALAGDGSFWVVGNETKEGLVEKVSVIRIVDADSNRTLMNRTMGRNRTKLLLR